MMDIPPAPRAPRFDPSLDAWVLGRYADVAAALRHPELRVPGSDAESPEPGVAPATARELSPSRVAAWRAGLESEAHQRLHALPIDQPVDLLSGFAAPWSLALALRVTGAPAADAAELLRPSRVIFLAAAHATRAEVQPEAAVAAAELAGRLRGAGGPLGVQTFVALTQTLPALIAAAWLELLRRPALAAHLRARPERLAGAVEELLRVASPARAVFRRARRALRIGGAAIGEGDPVVLMLGSANRDPARFPDPDRPDPERRSNAHLAFGAGPHGCVGAGLVRMAVEIATDALLRVPVDAEVFGAVEWVEGFAIRAPASLTVVLRGRRGGGGAEDRAAPA